MSKIKNGGLDQNGAGPFEQQQFGTVDVKGVKNHNHKTNKVIGHHCGPHPCMSLSPIMLHLLLN